MAQSGPACCPLRRSARPRRSSAARGPTSIRGNTQRRSKISVMPINRSSDRKPRRSVMGAARHRSCLLSALVLAMLSAVSPPAARAQQSMEDFRQSLLDLAAALDALGGSGGSFAIQRDGQEASPEAIELIQQALARQGSPNAVEEALQHLTPPPLS